MTITLTLALWMVVPAALTVLWVAFIAWELVDIQSVSSDTLLIAGAGWICTAGVSLLTGCLK